MLKKRIIAMLGVVTLTASMLLPCTRQSIVQAAPDTAQAVTVPSTEEQNICIGQGTVGDKWYVSSIAGVVNQVTDVSLKDDFFTAVNKEYLSGLVIEEGYSTAGVIRDASKIMRSRTLELLQTENPQGHNAELVTRLYHAAMNWEERNKVGVQAIEPSVEQIKAIQTIEDVARYEMTATDMFNASLVAFSVENSLADPGNYTVGIYATPLFLNDPEEYFNQSENGAQDEVYYRNLSSYMLGRLGFSEEETLKVITDCKAFETAIAEHMLTQEEYYADDIYDKIINVYTLEELRKKQGNYPLVEILNAYGMGGSATYNLYEPEWLMALSELYTEDNLELIKNYLLAHYVVGVMAKTDREAYDTAIVYLNERYGMTGTKPEEEIGLDVVNQYLSQPMDYVYIDAYCTEQERQEVIDLIHGFEAYYRKMLEKEDWLSEKTRQSAIEKLDHITIRACYSDTREDYSSLVIEEGESFLDTLQAIRRYDLALEQAKINQKVNPDIWLMSTRDVNAYYDPSDNSINILCGILVDTYSMDQPFEAVLATIGNVIGHEISHAFDTNGAQFDKDGNYKDWWEKEDYAAFNKRADSLVAYMNQIIPYAGAQPVNGELEKTEMIADMAGMKASLMMAADIEGFDYDAFFRAYAKSWAGIATKNNVISWLQTDPHPLENLRVNIPVQHSDEFLRTYDIQPGDGMYLAPEDRVEVW